CGIYGYPLEQAAAIAVEEVCRQRPAHSSLEEIVLVAFDSSMAERYQRLLGERPVAR
ncbi:O-acetyl-ADP-ribose deacetylase, partial [Pseudomonas aeruginosa]|nr:O-acetyl-ADP-ribose deacetylase [Pseudomonas aeruginosa]